MKSAALIELKKHVTDSRHERCCSVELSEKGENQSALKDSLSFCEANVLSVSPSEADIGKTCRFKKKNIK